MLRLRYKYYVVYWQQHPASVNRYSFGVVVQNDDHSCWYYFSDPCIEKIGMITGVVPSVLRSWSDVLRDRLKTHDAETVSGRLANEVRMSNPRYCYLHDSEDFFNLKSEVLELET